jgi:hypothetical protein
MRLERIPIMLQRTKLVIPGERPADKAALVCQPAHWFGRFIGGARGKGSQVLQLTRYEQRSNFKHLACVQDLGSLPSPRVARLAGNDISDSTSAEPALTPGVTHA